MTSLRFPTLILAATFTLTATPIPAAAQPGPNLVQNGDFELGVGDKDLPTAWQTSGRADIEQSLVLDTGRIRRQVSQTQLHALRRRHSGRTCHDVPGGGCRN